MGDFSSGFGTGFQIGAIIKEKKIAKKATEDLQAALQEWQMSGKEPSYVDKLMLGLTATKVGENYSRIFGDIINNQASYDKEKMSQNAINLREYNAQVLNFVKMIQTSAKEGTLDLIPWDSVQALMPDVDLSEVLNNIPALKEKQEETQTRAEAIDIYGKTPESIRQAVGEQAGLIPTGLEPTPKEAPQLSAADSFFIERWQKGEFSTDTLLKHFSAWVDTDKRTNLQKELDYGKEQGITFTPEEVKKKILGTAGGGEIEGETVTTLKNWEAMFDIKSETGPKTEEEYNRALDLLAQSKDAYRPKYATWKEALIAEVKGIAEDLKVLSEDKSNVRDKDGMTPQDNFKFLLNIYLQKLEEIKTKYPEVDLNQFPKFEENKGFWQKLIERGKYQK